MAQLASAPPWHGGGWGFKSPQVHHGPVAQLVERCIRIAKVGGSNPPRSTINTLLKTLYSSEICDLKSDWLLARGDTRGSFLLNL